VFCVYLSKLTVLETLIANNFLTKNVGGSRELTSATSKLDWNSF